MASKAPRIPEAALRSALARMLKLPVEKVRRSGPNWQAQVYEDTWDNLTDDAITKGRLAAAKLSGADSAARMGDSKSGAALDVSARPAKEPDQSAFNGRLAKRIRELRTKRGQSIEVFMDALAQHGVVVNRSLVYAWENGSKLIHPNNYPAIAKALGCKSVRSLLPDE